MKKKITAWTAAVAVVLFSIGFFIIKSTIRKNADAELIENSRFIQKRLFPLFSQTSEIADARITACRLKESLSKESAAGKVATLTREITEEEKKEADAEQKLNQLKNENQKAVAKCVKLVKNHPGLPNEQKCKKVLIQYSKTESQLNQWLKDLDEAREDIFSLSSPEDNKRNELYQVYDALKRNKAEELLGPKGEW